MKFRFFIMAAAAAVILSAAPAAGQTSADALRKAYDFGAAVEFCKTEMEKADSSQADFWQDELVLSQNGLSMAGFCSQPAVVAKYRFPVEDFFLFYPMQNRSWRNVPNCLDSLATDPLVKGMYAPDDATTLYYSAEDADGIRNIYRTHLRDTIWSVPELINEQVTTSSNEIYPTLSADGKSLYFASEGLYGMGGYDIYISRWDDERQDWGIPTNLGFPYSSPFDDFLYINTDDGQHTIFASNRECSRDSVYIYVLEFDSMPIHKSVESADDLRALCSLTPQSESRGMGNASSIQGSIPEDENVLKYKEAMNAVRAMRDSISRFNDELGRMRAELKSDEITDRKALTDEILKRELALPGKQAQLTAAIKELQKIEMDFLREGVVIDPDKIKAEADREVVGTSSTYVFSKNEMGPALDIAVEVPEPTFDYSFKILDEGQFAEDNTLPDGIVYQIQLFATARKATIKELKGLSPVFERQSNGKNVYSAGLFRTYADVLGNLNKVKKAGFKTAMIVAFNDGKPVSVTSARSLESKVNVKYLVKVYPDDGQSLSDAVLAAIHQQTDSDIVRLTEGAATVYEIGPFDSKQECEELVAAIIAAGATNAAITSAE